ncbi:MAG: hypothetical protein ACXAC5_10190 [Promethearchaeota archaeon]|jgi:hypothetical protein
MRIRTKDKNRLFCLILIIALNFIIFSSVIGLAEVDYEFDYQDPAGDVLEFNETWSNVGTVDSHPQIDMKWLRSSNDTSDNVTIRMEFRNNQVIEISNETKYVIRIFTSSDNSTGYNITFINGSSTILSFDNSTMEDMASNTSIIDDKGEVLVIKVSKSKYLNNISYFNLDAFTWKETQNRTYIDYISEIPGHPGETGTVVDQENGDSKEEKGILDNLCSMP